MGTPAGTHQPLSLRDRARLSRATRHLRSPFHSVRQAALREIHAILSKRRGLKRRLAERLKQARSAAMRKATPKRLHKALGVQKRAPQQARGRTADVPLASLPKRGLTPAHGFNQTKEQLRERARGGTGQTRGPGQAEHTQAQRELQDWDRQKSEAYDRYQISEQRRLAEENNRMLREQRAQQRRSGQQPARQPDAMQQATEAMRRAHQQPQPARSPGRPGQASPFTQHTAAPGRRTAGREAETQKAVRDITSTFAKYYPDVPPVPDRTCSQDGARKPATPAANVPAPPGHPESVRKAAEDHEKGRWAGLHKRLTSERTARHSRSRTRTTA